jgi:hypothetical protein
MDVPMCATHYRGMCVKDPAYRPYGRYLNGPASIKPRLLHQFRPLTMLKGTMNVNDPLYHAAPLHQLVKGQLHKGTDLKARVQKLRWKRRKAKQTDVEVGIDKLTEIS